MMLRRPPVALPLLCLIALALSSCVAVRRQISRPGGKTTQTLLVADTATLLQIVTRQYNAIHDFSATVDLVPALGTTEKSRITEYKDIRGYILFRKPADIRIIGLYPVVRNKLFDMVSNGADFKLYLTFSTPCWCGRWRPATRCCSKISPTRTTPFTCCTPSAKPPRASCSFSAASGSAASTS
jgi:hypothetical protein